MALALNYADLDASTVQRTLRTEVGERILSILGAWLPDKLGTGKYHPLPTVGLEPFACRVFGEEEGLLVTLGGVRMPSPDDPPDTPLLVPLLNFGAASTQRGSNKVWPILCRQLGVDLTPAELPWCAQVRYPTLDTYPVDTSWVSDFQRCLAWAWFEHHSKFRT